MSIGDADSIDEEDCACNYQNNYYFLLYLGIELFFIICWALFSLSIGDERHNVHFIIQYDRSFGSGRSVGEEWMTIEAGLLFCLLFY